MLNNKEKELLKEIMNNNYAAGPFTGMCYNAHISSGKPIEECIQKALQVRLTAQELIQ